MAAHLFIPAARLGSVFIKEICDFIDNGVLSKVYPPHSRFSLEFQRLEEKKLATPVVFGHH
ncbi:hypothetical protein P9199_10450 [Geobacillus stearothermophilus]|uniref:hypothetical protein n=1 Tax=Geobacillus stearothermophilus TaxID=1422 RepID=UPI002E22AE40|nr:hypothetical protein [Geobacillus stearothermophilus]MED4301569.1 hypothetical protein [Geobacillus stearothermophilus]